MSAWLVRDSLIDCKEVTVHWTHGNAVVNHTLCVFRWLIFQFPRSPISCPYLGRYGCPAPDINRDLNVSSVKTDFGTREAFFRLLVQRYNIFELKTNFSATDFSGVVVSAWLIALYRDILEINCCILTDFEENEGLRLRILEKRSFGHGHVRSKSFSGALGHPII